MRESQDQMSQISAKADISRRRLLRAEFSPIPDRIYRVWFLFLRSFAPTRGSSLFESPHQMSQILAETSNLRYRNSARFPISPSASAFYSPFRFRVFQKVFFVSNQTRRVIFRLKRPVRSRSTGGWNSARLPTSSCTTLISRPFYFLSRFPETSHCESPHPASQIAAKTAISR